MKQIRYVNYVVKRGERERTSVQREDNIISPVKFMPNSKVLHKHSLFVRVYFAAVANNIECVHILSN